MSRLRSLFLGNNANRDLLVGEIFATFANYERERRNICTAQLVQNHAHDEIAGPTIVILMDEVLQRNLEDGIKYAFLIASSTLDALDDFAKKDFGSNTEYQHRGQKQLYALYKIAIERATKGYESIVQKNPDVARAALKEISLSTLKQNVREKALQTLIKEL